MYFTETGTLTEIVGLKDQNMTSIQELEVDLINTHSQYWKKNEV